MMTSNKIEVREVTTKADLRRFVDYPNVLYKDVPVRYSRPREPYISGMMPKVV